MQISARKRLWALFALHGAKKEVKNVLRGVGLQVPEHAVTIVVNATPHTPGLGFLRRTRTLTLSLPSYSVSLEGRACPVLGGARDVTLLITTYIPCRVPIYAPASQGARPSLTRCTPIGRLHISHTFRFLFQGPDTTSQVSCFMTTAMAVVIFWPPSCYVTLPDLGGPTAMHSTLSWIWYTM